MTGIEWTDRTWNPTTGCDRVSPGCDHCYAMTMAKRLKGMGSAKYQRDGDPQTSGPGFGVSMHADTLDEPLRWKKPQRVFVNSMSDLFHDGIDGDFIIDVFVVMAMAPQHTFQVLTKRHARLRSLLSSEGFYDEVLARLSIIKHPDPVAIQWPLPNVWLGVSAENQQWADIRIPVLLDTPAAVRFLSAEPLLGPIDLIEPSRFWVSAFADTPHVDWVIAGGESGHGARPMNPDWVRTLRNQCKSTLTPFLFKQWGEWTPERGIRHSDFMQFDNDPGSYVMRVGKKAAGRELDGRTWDEYPVAVKA